MINITACSSHHGFDSDQDDAPTSDAPASSELTGIPRPVAIAYGHRHRRNKTTMSDISSMMKSPAMKPSSFLKLGMVSEQNEDTDASRIVSPNNVQREPHHDYHDSSRMVFVHPTISFQQALTPALCDLDNLGTIEKANQNRNASANVDNSGSTVSVYSNASGSTMASDSWNPVGVVIGSLVETIGARTQERIAPAYLNGSGSTVSLYSNGSELTIASGSCNPVAAFIGTPIDADQVSNLDDFAVMSEQPPAELGAYVEQMCWDGVHDLYPLNQFAPSDEEDGIAVFDAAYIVGKALVLEAEWKHVSKDSEDVGVSPWRMVLWTCTSVAFYVVVWAHSSRCVLKFDG
jgi:hypothetical protein